MKYFKTLKDIQGAYVLLKKGYTDMLDYPNIYYKNSGILLICQGHGVYTELTKKDYKIIEKPVVVNKILSWLQKL